MPVNLKNELTTGEEEEEAYVDHVIRVGELLELFGLAGRREPPLGQVTELAPKQTVVGQIVPKSVDLRGSGQADCEHLKMALRQLVNQETIGQVVTWIQVGEYLAGDNLGKQADHVTAIGLAVEMRLRYPQRQQVVLTLAAVFLDQSKLNNAFTKKESASSKQLPAAFRASCSCSPRSGS